MNTLKKTLMLAVIAGFCILGAGCQSVFYGVFGAVADSAINEDRLGSKTERYEREGYSKKDAHRKAEEDLTFDR